MNDSVGALRSQLLNLQSEHERGRIGAEAFASAKADLEQQLLAQVMQAPPEAAKPAPPRPKAGFTALLSVAVLALALVGYLWKGSPGVPSVGAPGVAGSQAEMAELSPAEQEASFAAAVEELAQRLAAAPDNGEGWAMLARSYARLARHAEAIPAFERAIQLTPQDARLIADFADTVAMHNGRTLEGRPTELVEQALRIDPDNAKALALAGTAAFNRKDYKAAVGHWEHLARISATDAAFLPQLQGSIQEARSLAGLPAAAPAAAAPHAGNSGNSSGAQAEVSKAASPSIGPVAAVSGSVSLSPDLARLASPEDTVFIFARPADGSRMPLAILRKQVKDLPLQFRLDDSQAMAPAARLSLFPQVVVSARVSKSGQATPMAGDLSGQSHTVGNSAQGVVVVINEVVRP